MEQKDKDVVLEKDRTGQSLKLMSKNWGSASGIGV
jgi:hypothetical protein